MYNFSTLNLIRLLCVCRDCFDLFFAADFNYGMIDCLEAIHGAREVKNFISEIEDDFKVIFFRFLVFWNCQNKLRLWAAR